MLTVPFIVLVLLTFVTLIAAPCNLVALPVLHHLADARPQARTPLLLLLVAAPWLLGGGVLISSVVDVFFGACDSGNICLWNEDPRRIAPWRVSIVVPLALSACMVGVRLGLDMLRSRAAVRTLLRTSVADPLDGAFTVASPVPLAFAAQGRVFISQGLRSGLTPMHITAVLAHEAAHVRRSDGVAQVIARALSCALVPPVRRRVLDALTLANEQSCDDAASQVVGRLQAAQAILAAERLCVRRSPALGPAFTENCVPARVRSLLLPVPAPWRHARVYGSVICGLLSIFLLGDLLYYVSMIVLYPSSLL